MTRVFLTGGTGLVGSHLAQLLIRGGHEVVALHRPGADVRFLRALGCVLLGGDVLATPDELAAAIQGCDVVVHAAGLVYSGPSWPAIREVNVEGTRHVLEGAARAGAGRAVFLSSVVVYGTPEGRITEDAPTDGDLPPTDLYARSKREAESVAREVEAKREIAVTVLRPSAVYGERDRLMAPVLAHLVSGPLIPLLGRGDNTLPVVYAGNVASAIVACLEAERGGATYDVGRDHPLTQRELLEGIARGMGKRARFVRIPARLIRGAAAALDRMGVGTPGARHLPATRAAALALGENPFPSERIRRELGWNPPFQHAAALERTGRWLAARRGGVA